MARWGSTQQGSKAQRERMRAVLHFARKRRLARLAEQQEEPPPEEEE